MSWLSFTCSFCSASWPAYVVYATCTVMFPCWQEFCLVCCTMLRLLGHTAYILHRQHGCFSCTVWMSSCDTLYLINSFADVLLSTPSPTRLFVTFLAFMDAGRLQRSFPVRLCDHHRIRPPIGSPYGRPDRRCRSSLNAQLHQRACCVDG